MKTILSLSLKQIEKTGLTIMFLERKPAKAAKHLFGLDMPRRVALFFFNVFVFHIKLLFIFIFAIFSGLNHFIFALRLVIQDRS